MSPRDKPLVWLRGEIRTPPCGADARVEAGFLLRRLQRGGSLVLPHSRPMPGIGASRHELRIIDAKVNWRIMYHIAADAIVILDVFKKQIRATPNAVITAYQRRLGEFRRLTATRKGTGDAQR